MYREPSYLGKGVSDIYIYIVTREYIYINIYIYIVTRESPTAHIHIYICIHTYIHINIFIYVYIYVYIYICVCFCHLLLFTLFPIISNLVGIQFSCRATALRWLRIAPGVLLPGLDSTTRLTPVSTILIYLFHINNIYYIYIYINCIYMYISGVNKY